MERYKKYKIWIIILAAVAVIEAIMIFGLLVSRPKKRIVRIQPPHAPAVEIGKIAIVLDDWGYNLNNLPILKQIKYPMTLSILPNLAYSKRINQEGRALGCEII